MGNITYRSGSAEEYGVCSIRAVDGLCADEGTVACDFGLEQVQRAFQLTFKPFKVLF